MTWSASAVSAAGLAAGAHDLVDAAPVVREEHACAVDHDRRAAVVDLERMIGRAGKVPGEVDEEVGVGARVAVDHLVVVAHAEHVVGGRGEEPHEQQVRGAQVLELVDQEMPALALHRAAQRGIATQRLDRACDLAVEIGGVVTRERVAVVVVHRREALDVAALALDVRGGAQPELHLLERFEVGPQRVGVGAKGELEMRLDALADLAFVEDAHAGAGPPHDLVAERIECADLVARAAGQVVDAVLHLRAGPPVVRECAHARGAVGTLDHEMAEPRSEHCRLARAGGREDARGPARVQHRGALVGRELVEGGVRRGVDIGAETAGLDRDAVHDVLGGEQPRGARSTVAPHRGVVAEQHIGGAARTRAEPLRFGSRAPARRAGPRVVVVRANEEVAALAGEVEVGRELVREPVVTLGRAQRLPRHAQVDDHRGARRPELVELVDRRAWVRERGIVDDHAGRTGPRLGCGRAGLDDDAAAQRGRARR